MYRLAIEDEEGTRNIVPIARPVIAIGRREGSTIRLTAQNVSRNHARLQLEDDELVLMDESRYGTWVNDERIHGRVFLEAGDRVRVGDYVITVLSEEVEQASDATDERITEEFAKASGQQERASVPTAGRAGVAHEGPVDLLGEGLADPRPGLVLAGVIGAVLAVGLWLLWPMSVEPELPVPDPMAIPVVVPIAMVQVEATDEATPAPAKAVAPDTAAEIPPELGLQPDAPAGQGASAPVTYPPMVKDLRSPADEARKPLEAQAAPSQPDIGRRQARPVFSDKERAPGRRSQSPSTSPRRESSGRELASAHFQLGRDLHANGRVAEAELELKKAVKIYPRHAEAWLVLGLIFQKTGRKDMAKDALQRFIALSPNDPRKSMVNTMVNSL